MPHHLYEASEAEICVFCNIMLYFPNCFDRSDGDELHLGQEEISCVSTAANLIILLKIIAFISGWCPCFFLIAHVLGWIVFALSSYVDVYFLKTRKFECQVGISMLF